MKRRDVIVTARQREAGTMSTKARLIAPVKGRTQPG